MVDGVIKLNVGVEADANSVKKFGQDISNNLSNATKATNEFVAGLERVSAATKSADAGKYAQDILKIISGTQTFGNVVKDTSNIVAASFQQLGSSSVDPLEAKITTLTTSLSGQLNQLNDQIYKSKLAFEDLLSGGPNTPANPDLLDGRIAEIENYLEKLLELRDTIRTQLGEDSMLYTRADAGVNSVTTLLHNMDIMQAQNDAAIKAVDAQNALVEQQKAVVAQQEAEATKQQQLEEQTTSMNTLLESISRHWEYITNTVADLTMQLATGDGNLESMDQRLAFAKDIMTKLGSEITKLGGFSEVGGTELATANKEDYDITQKTIQAYDEQIKKLHEVRAAKEEAAKPPKKSDTIVDEQQFKMAKRIAEIREELADIQKGTKYSTEDDLPGTAGYEQRIQYVKELRAELDALENSYKSLYGTEDGFVKRTPDDDKDKWIVLSTTMNVVRRSIAGISQAISALGNLFTKELGRAVSITRTLGKALSSVAGVATKMYGSLFNVMAKLFSTKRGGGLGMLKQFTRRMLMMTVGIYSLRSAFSKLRRMMIEGFKEIAQHSERFNTAISTIKSTFSQFKMQVSAAIEPLVVMFEPIITRLIQRLNAFVTAITQFMGALAGVGKVLKATYKYTDYAKSLGGASKAAKDLMGFDEINRLSDKSGAGSSAPVGWEWLESDDFGILDKLKEFKQKIMDSWKVGDFEWLGRTIGEGLSRGLELIPWKTIQENIVRFASSLATLINGFFETPGLLYNLGSALANAFNTLNLGIRTFFDKLHGVDIGKALADFFNGAIKSFDPVVFGDAIGKMFRTIIDIAWGFVTTFDWSAAGEKLAATLNSVVNTLSEIDADGMTGWQKLGKTLFTGLMGALNAVTEFAKDFDWVGFGTSIGQFLGEIDWSAIFGAMSGAAGKIISGLGAAIKAWGEANPESLHIVETILGVLLTLDIVGTLGKISMAILPVVIALSRLGVSFLEVITIIGKVGGVVAAAVGFIATFVAGWVEGCDLIKTVLLFLFGIVTSILAVGGAIPGLIAAAIAWLTLTLHDNWASVKEWFSHVIEDICNMFKGLLDTIIGFFTGFFTGDWNKFLDGLGQMGAGFVNLLIDVLTGVINLVIDLVNSLKIDIPDWVPLVGGKHFEPGIPKLNIPKVPIPQLAKGAVLPPNQPFMAMVGDQAHGTNIEAPLDTIKQAVAEELSEQIDAMMVGFQAVVDAINNKNLVIDEDAIGKSAYNYNTRQSFIRGGV